jgi:hypothetical protein
MLSKDILFIIIPQASIAYKLFSVSSRQFYFLDFPSISFTQAET